MNTSWSRKLNDYMRMSRKQMYLTKSKRGWSNFSCNQCNTCYKGWLIFLLEIWWVQAVEAMNLLWKSFPHHLLMLISHKYFLNSGLNFGSLHYFIKKKFVKERLIILPYLILYVLVKYLINIMIRPKILIINWNYIF